VTELDGTAPPSGGAAGRAQVPAVDAPRAARLLDGESPEHILAWACEHVGTRLGFATGFGLEGCVLVDMIARARLPIDIFTLDTGLLFPETHELWRRLESRYGITIRAVRPAQTVSEQSSTQGAELWRRDPDRCCELRKLEPLRATLGKLDGWVTAIRREQTLDRANAQVVEHDRRFGLTKINPLVAWTHDQVWAHIYLHDVPVNTLHERGYPSIGCEPCTSPIVPGEALRAGRWRGTNKTECGLHAVRKVGT
jgi:phosphoadenylyl-sulfate reductase (thioredoxin)